MISGLTNITKEFHPTQNFWELNPQLIYLQPFSDLYNADTSKDHLDSSKDMWCVLWMVDPDEDVNKFYRVPYNDRVQVCIEYNSKFDINHPRIVECMRGYNEYCLSADEKAYKMQKDQLIQITEFLNTIPIDLDNIGKVIDLKAKLPKIYSDFEKVDKLFKKIKSEQRIYGGRKQTARETGRLLPDD